ncbi:hypothetical protein AWZ03_014396, partial [Drosophila navojoa]
MHQVDVDARLTASHESQNPESEVEYRVTSVERLESSIEHRASRGTSGHKWSEDTVK